MVFIEAFIVVSPEKLTTNHFNVKNIFIFVIIVYAA